MANTFKVRNYIRAKSEKRLRLLMFQKQVKLGMASLAFDITYAKGAWYAWYYEIASNDALEEVADVPAKDN